MDLAVCFWEEFMNGGANLEYGELSLVKSNS